MSTQILRVVDDMRERDSDSDITSRFVFAFTLDHMGLGVRRVGVVLPTRTQFFRARAC